MSDIDQSETGRSVTYRDTRCLTRSTPAYWPPLLIGWQRYLDQWEALRLAKWPMRSSVWLPALVCADIFIKEVMRLHFCNSLRYFPRPWWCEGGAMLPGAEDDKWPGPGLTRIHQVRILTAGRSLLLTTDTLHHATKQSIEYVSRSQVYIIGRIFILVSKSPVYVGSDAWSQIIFCLLMLACSLVTNVYPQPVKVKASPGSKWVIEAFSFVFGLSISCWGSFPWSIVRF